MDILTIKEMSKSDLIIAISVLESTIEKNGFSVEQQTELKKALDDLVEEYKGRNKSEKIKAFFNLNKREREYFYKWKKANDEIVEEFHIALYLFVNDLIELYDEIAETCDECDNAKEFIFKCDEIGLSDNTMCDCLKVSYFYCVGAIIEWLDHISEIY